MKSTTPGHTATGKVHVNTADLPAVLVAVPCGEWMWSRSAMALLQLTNHLPPGSGIVSSHLADAGVAANRNLLVQDHFVPNTTRDWLLFIDSDMVPPPNVAVHLLGRALGLDGLGEKDIVSATCRNRRPDHGVCASYLPDAPSGICVPVFGVGFGCVLIRRRVFEALPFPWFTYPESPGMGEDNYFCWRAREAGFTIWLDQGIEAGHVGVMEVNTSFAVAWSRTAAKPVAPVPRAALPEPVAQGRIITSSGG